MENQNLSSLIFNSGLFEHSNLSERESHVLILLLKNNSTINEISNEYGISEKKTKTFIDNGIEKLTDSIKQFISNSILLDKTQKEKNIIKQELIQLKAKFRKEIALETQLLMNFEDGATTLSKIKFSVRAIKVLKKLNILTVNDFNLLTKDQLKSVEKIGHKTMVEIIERAETFGIIIK